MIVILNWINSHPPDIHYHEYLTKHLGGAEKDDHHVKWIKSWKAWNYMLVNNRMIVNQWFIFCLLNEHGRYHLFSVSHLVNYTLLINGISGHYAGVRHNERKIIWKYKELDSKYWRGEYSLKVEDYILLNKCKWMVINNINLLLIHVKVSLITIIYI